MTASRLFTIPFRLVQYGSILVRRMALGSKASMEITDMPRALARIQSKLIIIEFWCGLICEHLRWHWMSIKWLQNHHQTTNEKKSSRNLNQSDNFNQILWSFNERGRNELYDFPNYTKIGSNFEKPTNFKSAAHTHTHRHKARAVWV